MSLDYAVENNDVRRIRIWVYHMKIKGNDYKSKMYILNEKQIQVISIFVVIIIFVRDKVRATEKCFLCGSYINV